MGAARFAVIHLEGHTPGGIALLYEGDPERPHLFTGDSLSGSEAAEWGVIHRSVPPVDLDATVGALTERLASGPTVALGLTKWLLRAGQSETLDQQLHNEALALELSSRSEDFREGLAAFKDKRSPKFGGR